MCQSILSIVLATALMACGSDNVYVELQPNRDSKPIIDGMLSSALDHPSTAALLIRATDDKDTFGDFVCSAVLIAPQVALTAAHCIHMFESPNEPAEYPLDWYLSFYTDVSGFYDNPDKLPPLTYKVRQHHVNPDFSAEENKRIGLGPSHDIALLFLERAVDIIWPTSIYPHEWGQNLSPGQTVSVAGYGQREMEAGAGPMGTRYFGTSYIHEVGNYEMRVGKRTSANQSPPHAELAEKCYGDSGGPSFLEHNGITYVVGLTSRGYNLETDCLSAGVDIRVDVFEEWIHAICYDEGYECRSLQHQQSNLATSGCTNLGAVPLQILLGLWYMVRRIQLGCSSWGRLGRQLYKYPSLF